MLGSGDISFDPQGRAREDVGDMITVLDPQTNEMDFISVKDVKLDHVETAEDYGNKYRQYLQELNSKAYAEAQAEQAQQEGNNPPSETSIQPITNDGKGGMDKNGNVLNSDGSIYTEKVGKIEEISEEDFNEPTRSVELPLLPKNVADALGSEGKPVVIKKSIFEKNLTNHPELEPEDSRAILAEALYNPNLVGQTQPSRRPSYKVAVKTGDKNSVVVLDVYNDKKQIEIVGWRRINEKGLAKMQRQAEREVGQFLILSPKNGSAAALSTLPHGLSSVPKDSNNSPNNGENKQTLTFSDGTPVPLTKDSKGRDVGDYSKMTPQQAAEYIKMVFGENAEKAIDGKIKRAEAAVKAADKMKVDYSADEGDALEAEAKKKAAMEAAQKELAFFTTVKNIMKQTEAKEQAGGGGLTGNRYDQWRKDGYHIGEGGVRYDRQKKEDMTGAYGRDVQVDFTPTVGVKGRAKVVEVDSVQASHVNGQVNPMHFGPDWQPKDRTDAASKLGQDKALTNFDPEKITGDGNAFIGSSPSVNERHEVIQGNNRVEILRRLYDEQPEKAAAYKQWLIDHAAEFGYDPAEIAKMKRPVLVNELPVDDATAKELGQYRASDFESGGKEIPRASVVINRLGEKMQNVANILLNQGSLSDDAKMSDLIAQNANKVLDFLAKEGVLSATEQQTLRKDNTAMRQWMEELLKANLFDGDKETEAAFNQLPDNARRAVLATYMRDAKSEDAAKIKQNLQHSFEAYVQMMNDPAFANAKNVADARAAVAREIEKGNESLFGEAPIREKFSNFELELAALYKGLKDQKTLKGLLTKYFDAVQGDKAIGRQLEIGEEPRDAISKDDAIKEVFGLHDSKPAETQRQVDEAVKGLVTEITKQVGDDFVETNDKVAQSALDDAEATDSHIRFHKETDKETLDALNSGKTIKVYRAMQVIDGKLYLPMAAYADGKLVEANEIGQWIKSDEMTDSKNVVYKLVGTKLTIPKEKAVKGKDGIWRDSKSGKPIVVDEESGEPTWYFKLQKGKGATGKKLTDVPAAYNPYWHTSRSPLNDQFKSAWIRPNIVVVECEVPSSELSSGYKAEHAKDKVGMTPWTSGVVTKQLVAQGHEGRKVMLSRWCKPVRVLPDSEVAAKIKDFIGDYDVEIPENVVTPKQRVELEKLGVKIGAPEKGVKKSEQILEALELGLQVDNTVREHRASAGSTIRDWGKTPEKLRMNKSQLTDDIMQFAGSAVTRLLSKAGEDDVVSWNVKTNGNWYFFRVDQDYDIMVDYAVPADNAHFEEFKEIIKNYGVNSSPKAFRRDMQKVGIPDGLYRDISDYFKQQRNPKFSALGSRVHEGEGETRDKSLRSINGDSQETTQSNGVLRQIKEFRSKDGEVYGFTDGEKIYLDTKKMKPETPLHEYTHLWSDALRRVNPEEWEHVKGLFDKVDGLKEEVKKLYPELEGDDLYDEMIAVFSGREGAKKVEDVVRRLAAEDGKSVTESAKAMGFIERVKTALKAYWKGVADLLHLQPRK